MLVYNPSTPSATATPASQVKDSYGRAAWPPLKITGQNLAKGRRTKAQRIFLAEHLATGTVELCKPTLKQAAALARVSLADIYRARWARKPKPNPPSLAEHLSSSSPAERIEAARALGVEVVWDTMIMPIVAEEKASGPAVGTAIGEQQAKGMIP